MAGPSTTGQIGLDVTEFEKSWKSMLDRMEEAPARVGKVTGALSGLKSAFAAIGVLGFVKSLTSAGREASDLTRKLDRLDISTYADDFTKADAAARGFRGTIRDISGAVSSIPVVGQVFDLITAPIKAAADALDSYRQVKKEVGQAAAGSEALLQKLRGLEEQRAKVRKEESDSTGFLARTRVALAGIGGNQEDANAQAEIQAQMRANSLKRIEKERLSIVDEIAESFDLEARARNSAIAGSEKEAQLADIELNRRERIAALTEQVKNSLGLTSREGKAALNSGSSTINSEADTQVAAAQRRYDITVDMFKVSEKLSVNSLRASLGQLDSAKELFELAERTYNRTGGKGEEQQRAEKLKMDQAKVAYRQAEIAYGEEITALRLQTQATEAHFKGMQGVAEQAEIVAKFDKEIANQLRAGNKEAVDMLKRQKEIALAVERAREHDITPRKRREDRRESRITQRKAKQQEARENELRRRGARGIRGRAISEQQLKDRNANEGKLRMDQAASDARELKMGMIKLFGNVDSIAKGIKSDS